MLSTASATAGDTSTAAAFDGNGSTRWASGEGYNGDQWIRVDLGSAQTINHVTVKWESAYTSSYKIQVSNDGSSWTDIYTGTNPTGLTNPVNDITFASEWHTGAYSADYQVQVSNDGSNWTNVYTATGKSNGNPDDITFTTTSSRYVRVNCTRPITGYGYSIWELELY